MFILAKPRKSVILRDKVILMSLVLGVIILILFNGIFADIGKVSNPETLKVLNFDAGMLVERFYRGSGAALKLAITMLSFFLVMFTTPLKDTSYALEKWMFLERSC